jgi:uncharacterized protein YprB with RNaseH-like and TPR domain
MMTRERTIPARIYGTVIDLETTGLPLEGAEIITLGTVTGNTLRISQRTSERDFEGIVQSELRKLPRPFYAFNKSFEEGMLRISVDGELQAEDYEKKSRAINVAKLPDPFNGNGFEVVEAWREYLATGRVELLKAIMNHNETDLLLETCLLIVRHAGKRTDGSAL